MSKTTSLPRITPTSTPRSLSANEMYRPYPPPELSSIWNQARFPKRINPLSPPHPKKRINASWETTPQHWHNQRRSLGMQKREYERYHSAWSKPFYGPPADKEAYRKHFREVLKQQMSDLDLRKRQDFAARLSESEAAVEYDRECKTKDFQDFVTKFKYLKNYRDDNKTMMESAWERSKYNKLDTDRYDREVLRYNPINWSCTLK